MRREQWRSQWGFLFAAVGSAVGLGNIWRFSYMAYDNGGGAFLIPYFVALLTAGIPLLILEFATGHERIGSAPLAFAKINRHWEWLGWWAVVLVMFGIELYYTVIISWCMNFIYLSFNLAWGSDPNGFFFKDFLGVSKSPWAFGQVRWPVLLGLVVVWLINWFVVYRGIQRGIELANKIFMPLLLLLTIVMVVWSVNLDGAGYGVWAYMTPDFSKLSTPKVWLDAYSQIFFTLSLGFGIMIAYASYLPEKSDITGSAIAIAVINCAYSLFAGVAVFAVLGFMATAEGKEISEVVEQSIGLAFVAYPKALSAMPGGNIFGVIFFLSLVVAGLSSSVSIIEAFVSAMVDKFGINRGRLTSIVCVLGFLGSVLFTFQSGLLLLDIVDHFLTHYGLVVIGLGECILVGWLFRLRLLREHLNRISSIKLGVGWDWLIKFFLPVLLSVILVIDLVKELRQPYENYSWSALLGVGWNWLLITLLTALVLAFRPWQTKQRLANGRSDVQQEL